MMETLCDSLHNKLISLQSKLKVHSSFVLQKMGKKENKSNKQYAPFYVLLFFYLVVQYFLYNIYFFAREFVFLASPCFLGHGSDFVLFFGHDRLQKSLFRSFTETKF